MILIMPILMLARHIYSGNWHIVSVDVAFNIQAEQWDFHKINWLPEFPGYSNSTLRRQAATRGYPINFAAIMVKVYEHFLLKPLDKNLFTFGKMVCNVIAVAQPLNNLLCRLSKPNIHFLILLSSKSINQCARNWVDGHDISSLNKCLPSNLFRIWFFVRHKATLTFECGN